VPIPSAGKAAAAMAGSERRCIPILSACWVVIGRPACTADRYDVWWISGWSLSPFSRLLIGPRGPQLDDKA